MPEGSDYCCDEFELELGDHWRLFVSVAVDDVVSLNCD